MAWYSQPSIRCVHPTSSNPPWPLRGSSNLSSMPASWPPLPASLSMFLGLLLRLCKRFARLPYSASSELQGSSPVSFHILRDAPGLAGASSWGIHPQGPWPCTSFSELLLAQQTTPPAHTVPATAVSHPCWPPTAFLWAEWLPATFHLFTEASFLLSSLPLQPPLLQPQLSQQSWAFLQIRPRVCWPPHPQQNPRLLWLALLLYVKCSGPYVFEPFFYPLAQLPSPSSQYIFLLQTFQTW